MTPSELRSICEAIRLPARPDIHASGRGDLRSFHNRLIQEQERVVNVYNDQDLQDSAREAIPVERLHALAHEETLTRGDFNESLIRGLLQWFKNEFFKWVDRLPCDSCGFLPLSLFLFKPYRKQGYQISR